MSANGRPEALIPEREAARVILISARGRSEVLIAGRAAARVSR